MHGSACSSDFSLDRIEKKLAAHCGAAHCGAAHSSLVTFPFHRIMCNHNTIYMYCYFSILKHWISPVSGLKLVLEDYG